MYPGKGTVLGALADTTCHNSAQVGSVVEVLVREARKKDKEYVAEVMKSFGRLLKSGSAGDQWSVVWDLTNPHLTPKQPEDDENEKDDEVMKEDPGPVIIQTELHEASIRLLEAAWTGCTTKEEHFIESSTLLSNLFRTCTWQKQPVLLSALGVLIKESKELESEKLSSGMEVCLTHIMRGVDDVKHQHVRLSAIKLTMSVLELAGKRGFKLTPGTLETVLTHFRDQVSSEGNQNLKALGIEVVTLIEQIL